MTTPKSTRQTVSHGEAVPHGRIEDGYAMLTAAGLIVLGLIFLKASGLVTGGIAGLALFLSYWTGVPFGGLFLIANLPFMIFGFFAMGRDFAVKTVLLSLMVPALSLIAPAYIGIGHIHPGVAAIMGGTLVGYGLLAAARHNASVGGIGIVALWLQKRGIAKAGYIQLGFDLLLLLIAILRLSPMQLFWSALSMVAISAILIVWHRPGRYIGY
ncbi:MAG: YitT family protein [Sphingobium sp.]